VYVTAHIGVSSDNSQSLVAHILRVGGRETHPHTFCRLRHQRQQCRKIDNSPIGTFISIGIYVLSQQSHLFKTLDFQVGQLAENALGLAATLTTACVRDYTIGAKIIAPSHNRNESRNTVMTDTGRYNLPIGLGRGKLHIHGFFSPFGSPDQVR